MDDKQRALLRSISPYVPGSVFQRVWAVPSSEVVWEERREAAVLLADVSGFTAMSESLARMGKEGAEELTRVLNAYFTTMVDLVYEFRGEVVKFGGDAITCQFYGEQASQSANEQNVGMADALRRACACALAMQARMGEFHAVQTRAGVFELRMKIGISAGTVLSLSVGNRENGAECVLTGHPLDEMASAEHHAAAGEVLVWDDCLSGAGVTWNDLGIVVEPACEGFLSVKTLLGNISCPPKPDMEWDALGNESAEQIIRQLSLYMPSTVYAQIIEGQRLFVGEHRDVVSLFVSFAGLDYDNDPLAGHKLQQYFIAMQTVIHRYGGRLNWISAGDKGSLMHLIFGAPVAYEDNEERAVGCALELRREVAVLPFITSQRIGIASGPVFAGDVGSDRRRGYTVMGDVVNLSSRLMQAARAGEILLDERTARRAADEFVCEALAPISVKGKREPVPIWQAVETRQDTRTLGESAAKRHTSPFVGREPELEKIGIILAQARAGHGQLLVICGEAGVGKSRLVEELVVQARREAMLGYGGNCYAHGVQSPYLPWIGLLHALFGLDVEQSGGRLERIEQVMAAADPELKDWAPLMGQLLGLPAPDNALTAVLDAQLRKQRIFDIILALLRDRAEQTPLLLLIFEDVHWADAISLELLNYVARNIASDRILLAAVHRPTIEMVEWQRYEYCTSFTLTDLPTEDALALVKLKLGMMDVPDTLQALILRGETHINAFYLEEMVNALIDRGYLAPKGSGEGYEIAGDLSKAELPGSIQALVMSRIDQLDESSKLTVKVASVIGRTFLYRTLHDIYPVEISGEKLQGNLERLSRLDLTPLDRPAPEWEYIFKHVITQEVAYETLLYAHRRSLHHRVGEHLERVYAGSLGEIYDLLAHHYFHSGDAAKSWHYLVLAGDQAKSRYANEAATAHYRLALSIGGDNQSLYPVYESLGDVYHLTGQYEPAMKSYQSALDCKPAISLRVAEIQRKIAKTWELQGHYDDAVTYLDLARASLGDERDTLELALIYKDLGGIAMQRGDYDLALQFCAKGFGISTRLSDDRESQKVISDLEHILGTIYQRKGDLSQAILHFSTCIEARENQGDLFGMGVTYNNLAAVYWGQSDFNLVTTYLQKSLDICRKIGDTYGTAMCYNNLGAVGYTTCDYMPAIEFYEKSLEIRLRIGDLQGIADVYNNLGEVHRTLGNYQEALHYLLEAVKLFTELGDKMTLIDAYKLLSEVSLELCELNNALDYCQRALLLAQDLGNREYEGIAQRVLGQCLFASGQAGDARLHLQDSVKILETTGNRLELGKSCYEFGLALTAAEPESARQQLEKAAAIFEEVGVTVELEKTRAALQQLQ